ncbi:MAG: hypothetical protein B6226_03080 [Candidatus Cloacimonetes bacterium 4572_65]|nr:MAG: hypothetical protein B6226_03080 [Candidatus Cloacimonetes bacterium 4572_65]
MKKILIITLLLMSLLFVWGEGLKADLDIYAGEMEQHQGLVSDATLESLLERVASEDTEAFYELIEFLQGDYLDSLKSYLQAISVINPSTIEVKFLHKEFVEAYDALYTALTSARDLDIATLQEARNSLEAELPEEYNTFIFGITLFTIKMNTYSALNNELAFIVQFEK